MHHREPIWQDYRAYQFRHIPKGLLSWLMEPGSLTLRLRANSTTFQVKILARVWQQPLASERQWLGICARHWAYLREVLLVCDGKPWVFGRTIIPKTTLTGFEKGLLKIGCKPLGHLLFTHPHMTRSAIQIAQVMPHHYLFQRTLNRLPASLANLYARRSIFYLSGKPLLVSETFLPDFPFYEARVNKSDPVKQSEFGGNKTSKNKKLKEELFFS